MRTDEAKHRASRGARVKSAFRDISSAGRLEDLPSVREMAERVLAAFGGFDGYVKSMKAEFDAAKEGSQIRQRLAEMFMRTVAAGARVSEALETEEQDLEDDDLDREMAELGGRIAADAAGLGAVGEPEEDDETDGEEEQANDASD